MKRLLLLLILIPTLSSAQYNFIHYTKENKDLAYNSIRVMMEDSRGFVWIGTHKGLSRYDGTRFKNYYRDDFGVDSDYIIALKEDNKGNIWIGTDKGVVIYDYFSDSFEPLDLNINNRVFCFAENSKGEIWLGTSSNGFYKNTQKVDISSNPNSIIYKLAFDSKDKLWISLYCDNIYSLNNGLEKLYIDSDPDYFQNDDIEGLIVNPYNDEILYIASKNHGLCEVNTTNGKVSVLIKLSKDHRPIDLSKSKKSTLLLSTTEGLYIYDIQTKKYTHLQNKPSDRFSLSDSHTTSAFINNNGLWVGTLSGGVNHYGNYQKNFEKYYKSDDGISLEGCIVQDFTQDNKGNIYIATEKLGLFKLDTNKRLTQIAQTQIPNNITALSYMDNELWIGAQNGLYILNLNTERIKYYSHLSDSKLSLDNRILKFYHSSDNTLYLTTSLGIHSYDKKTESFKTIQSLKDLTIVDILEDVSGSIFMASYSNGLYVYNPQNDSFKNYCNRNGDSIIPEMTNSLTKDEDGDIYLIGFSSGFFKYNRKTKDFTQFSTQSNPMLPTNVYFSAASDKYGNLWLSTDSGLVKVNSKTNLVKVYGTGDGLLDTEFKKSILIAEDGRLFFGSKNGFIAFDPKDLESVSKTVNVSITDFWIGGQNDGPHKQNIDICDNLILKPQENSFAFSFATLNDPSSAYGRLMCYLEGYDSAWRDVSTSKSIQYYNIPTGKYNFCIKTVSHDGQEKPGHKTISITVEPRFWESPLGLTIILIFIILAIVSISRYLYKRAINKEKRKQEEIKKQRELQLYNEKMSFFANVIHEIKTPLTLIEMPLKNVLNNKALNPEIVDDLSVIANSTDYMDKLVKELLGFIKVEKHGYKLKLENIDIVEKLGFLCFNFAETAKSKNISLKYRHDKDCIYINADESALNKILNNLLHNAVKYAESFIDVHIYYENEIVSVSIRNDGPSIEKEHRESIFSPFVSYGNYSQSFGIGLSLAKTLTELHKGQLILEDDPTCTKFVLRMPSKLGEKKETVDESLEKYLNSSNKPLVVIVEDNTDLLKYLRSKLADEYRVIAVPSAEQALALLKRYEVDLLITDIALQNMPGVELCKKVSSDFELSHIPVIVISAISSTDTKIECMNNGAAMYLEKPFELDYLLSCVHSLIERKKKPSAISKDIEDVDRFAIPDIDEEFVKRLENVISENLSNPAFSNKQLEESLYMSHSTLNRKMKALYGTTPNEYLRTKRLAVAARLLESSNSQVNEICYAVGFSTSSYFSKCFKEQYGQLPLEYRAMRQNQ